MTLRVLIVDDDSLTLELFAEVLEHFIYACVGVPTATEAIAEIEQRPPDLLIADWDLGSTLSGVDVARQLRVSAPNSHLIMITGRHLVPLVEQTTELNVMAYLKKPFTPRELFSLIDGVQPPT